MTHSIDQTSDPFQQWRFHQDQILSPLMTRVQAEGLKSRIITSTTTPLEGLSVLTNSKISSTSNCVVALPYDNIPSNAREQFPSLNKIEPPFRTPPEEFPLSGEEIRQRNARVLDLSPEDLDRKLQKEFEDAQRHLDANHQDNWSKRFQPWYKTDWDKECMQGYTRGQYTDSFPDLFQEVGVAYTQGDYRKSMEDAYLIKTIKITVNDQTVLFPLLGIFDGHAGKECSEFFKKHLCNHLTAKLSEKIDKNHLNFTDLDIFNVLKLSFVELSREFRETLPSDNAKNVGSTATIALFIDQDVWVANAGDSRAILSIPEKTIALSEDANPTSRKYLKSIWKRGQIVFRDLIGTARVGGHLNMATAVGHDEELSGLDPRPKIIKFSLSQLGIKNPYLIIASDGLWNVGSSNQIAQTVQDLAPNKTSTEIAFELVKNAFQLGSQDNISVIVTKLRPQR